MEDFLLFDIFIGLLTNVIWVIIGFAFANRKRIKMYLDVLRFWNKDIRFSIAYLYRIKIANKYLLIKGEHIDQYQPVGGVYKVYDSFKELETRFEIRFENEVGFYEDGDLRFFSKGKYVLKILDWFNSRKNREVSVYREFLEEIITDNILPKEALRNIRIEYVKQIEPRIRFSTNYQKEEILIFDIYEIYLPKEYENLISDYQSKHDTIKLIDFRDIEKECVQINEFSKKIGAHSKYIL